MDLIKMSFIKTLLKGNFNTTQKTGKISLVMQRILFLDV